MNLLLILRGKSPNAVKARIEAMQARYKKEQHDVREIISLAVADRTATIARLQADLDEFVNLDRSF